MEELTFIKSLTPEEVFALWQSNEKDIEHWKPFWEAKGFNSWTEWRQATHKALFEKPLKWSLCKVEDPFKSTPEWRGGMFNAWNKWFYPVLSEQPPRFKDLIAHPGVHNHWFIRKIADNFETPTTVMAIRMPNGEICIAEGMHRCSAIALMTQEKRATNIEMNVMLAEWPENTPPKLGIGWDK